jgi:hypothetical protein
MELSSNFNIVKACKCNRRKACHSLTRTPFPCMTLKTNTVIAQRHAPDPTQEHHVKGTATRPTWQADCFRCCDHLAGQKG